MKNLVVFFLFLNFFELNAQKKDSAAIHQQFNNFWRYTQQYEIDSLLELLHPKLFTIASKKSLKESMLSMFTGGELQIKFLNNHLKSISKTFIYNEVKYALLTYDFDMLMSFTMNGELSKQNNLSLQYALPGLIKTFGKQNVELNETNQTVKIHTLGTLFAMNSNDNDWKFLERKEEQKAILKYLLPPAVIKKFQ